MRLPLDGSELGQARRKRCGCMVQWISPGSPAVTVERVTKAWRESGDEVVPVGAAAFMAQLEAALACQHNNEGDAR